MGNQVLFYALPPEGAGTDIERRVPKEDEGFSVAITPVFRISIPIIVRHGELDATFSISEVSLKQPEQPDSPLLLGLRMDRVGQRSVYGDLDVFYQDSPSDEEVLLAHFRDFVLYTSSNTRYTDLELHIPEGVDLSRGQLRIDYTSSEDDFPGPLTSFTFPLQQAISQ